MTSKRKLLRNKWLSIRTIDDKGNYVPSWNDFKKVRGLADNDKLKKDNEEEKKNGKN